MIRHWIVDSGTHLLANWVEAMPQATLLGPKEFVSIQPDKPGMIWVRLRSGETIDSVLSEIKLADKQFLIILADVPNEELVMQSIAAGAGGCCNTHAASEVLQQVALVVGNGGLWVGQSLLRQLVGSTARSLGERPVAAKNEEWASLLSEREKQVAKLVAAGASNREVAEQLIISERTAKAHLTSIFDKLGLRDRLQLSLKINGLTI